MHRQDVIRCVLEAIDDSTLVVSNIADTSWELCLLGDRPRNFYMMGSLGLAPSIALGLALSRSGQVVAINGDGALLFNLGCLPTVGRYRPTNLLHVVVDNGAHGATGYQPTATLAGTDLAAVARGCGLSARTVATREELRAALAEELARPQPAVIVARVTQRSPAAAPQPPYTGRQIRDRFSSALRESDVTDRRQVA